MFGLLSMGWAFTMLSFGSAHEIRPAVADVTVMADRIDIEIRLTGEPMVAGIDLEGLEDTNSAPQAAEHDALRALPDLVFAERFREAWPRLKSGVIVKVGDAQVPLNLDAIEVSGVPSLELPRDTVVRVSGALPEGDAPAQVGWVAAYGPIIVREEGAGDEGYAGFLDGGALSDPLPRLGGSSGSVVGGLKRFFGLSE